ncbi:hypothetical protein NVV95_08555 [Herbiconiux sp. CPCC 205716]|uniref:Uncharacterized protein n=1 Tax=Herbiconiux gentiana TaxID=2970912 RepID=A0ABT2GG63_9MICO|nr:hypothetical protein [Herbiconiux gentiana]MCS5714602.1 hypothetical protein [Herbiconiux gentiana]
MIIDEPVAAAEAPASYEMARVSPGLTSRASMPRVRSRASMHSRLLATIVLS